MKSPQLSVEFEDPYLIILKEAVGAFYFLISLVVWLLL